MIGKIENFFCVFLYILIALCLVRDNSLQAIIIKNIYNLYQQNGCIDEKCI